MENPSFRTGGLRGHRHPRPRKTRRSQGTRQRRPAEEQGARPGLRGVRWEVRGLDGAGPTGPRTGGGVSARRPRPLRHSRLGGSLPRACSHGVRTGSPGRTAGSPGGFSAARTVGVSAGSASARPGRPTFCGTGAGWPPLCFGPSGAQREAPRAGRGLEPGHRARPGRWSPDGGPAQLRPGAATSNPQTRNCCGPRPCRLRAVTSAPWCTRAEWPPGSPLPG